MFDNMFDDDPLDERAPAKSELQRYLETPPEKIRPDEALQWWRENQGAFPHLSRMAMDYLTIPGEFFGLTNLSWIFNVSTFIATSVDVERVFSKGRILLSHVRNRLSAQTTRAVLCVGSWSLLQEEHEGLMLIHPDDVLAVTKEPELEEEEADKELVEDWDRIAIE